MKKTITDSNRLPTFLASFLAITMFALAITGGFLNYSPIPFWDMWNGTLGFFMQIQDGNYVAWWAQHNEHRIILARIFFWMDYKLFSGQGTFLIVVNFFIVGVESFVFWLFMRRLASENRIDREKIWGLWFFITAWLFLWVQVENLTWGFQSQFFLAHLFPLISLYFLAKSTASTSWGGFVIACVFGLLSVGTMANGVLAFPIMFVYSMLMRQGFLKCVLLLLLAFLVPKIYFHAYVSPERHGHLSEALMNNPLGLMQYTMLYLGSPFYYLLGKGELGKSAATLFGTVLFVLSTLIAYRQLFTEKKSAMILALVFFIIYIGGTAFGTASGRLIFGLDQALSFRYTTPAIMAWAALIVAIWGSFSEHLYGVKKAYLFLFLSISLLMLGYQLRALENTDSDLSAREMAALALALDIKDSEYIRKIYPSTEGALNLAKEAIERNLSVFGKYPYHNLSQEIGTPYELDNISGCSGAFDKMEPIEGVSDYLRIHGWIFDSKTKLSPKIIRFINEQGVVSGFALTGTPRMDVKHLVDAKAGLSGFKGYIQASATGMKVIAIGDKPSCKLDIYIPPPKIINILTPADNSLLLSTISSKDIIENLGFQGTDYEKSSFDDLAVYGSFINGDSDKGYIKFNASKGDRFYYRSGPTSRRQIIKILNTSLELVLPNVQEWSVIEISGPTIPDKFEIELTDDGDNWGEWSAIALERK